MVGSSSSSRDVLEDSMYKVKASDHKNTRSWHKWLHFDAEADVNMVSVL